MRTILVKSLAVALLIYFVVSDLLITTPNVKRNPNPKLRYDVTLTINDAPAPFDIVTGFADYEVSDLSCVPVTGAPLNAMRIPPKDVRIEVVFKQISDHVYWGSMYLDGVVDEDYFGLGICHWSLDSIVVLPRTKNLTFHAGLSREEFTPEKRRSTFFDRDDFQGNQIERTVSGWLYSSQFALERKNQLFSITLSAKEAF